MAALMMLILFVLNLALFGATLHGLYLAFRASILLGVVSLLLPPLATVLSLFKLLGNRDLAAEFSKK